MKKIIPYIKYIFIIALVFSGTKSVKALSCSYGNTEFGIEFKVDEKQATYQKGSFVKTNMEVNTVNYSLNNFKDSSGKLVCPSSIYYKETATPDSSDIKKSYSFSFSASGGFEKTISLNGKQTENKDEEEKKQNGGTGQNTNTNNNKGNGKLYSDTKDCKGLLGEVSDPNSIAYWLQWILNIMKYLAIIALLALSTTDFIQALVKDDKDALKKAATKTLKRFIFAVLLFFLPIIVEVLMKLFGAYGTCNIG